MSIEDNKEVIRRHWAFMNHGEPQKAFELVAEDSTWKYMTNVPEISGDYGKAEMLQAAAAGDDTIFREGPQFAVLGMTAEEDRVAVELRSSGTMRDGMEMQQNYHNLYKVRDGLIKAVRVHLDSDHYRRVLEKVAAQRSQ